MQTFDDKPLKELTKIAQNLNKDNIGGSMIRAIALRSIILEPDLKSEADKSLDKIRAFTRNADIGWKIFETPIMPGIKLTELQIWQVIGIVGTLREFNYSVERVEEASLFTFENSAPVRFYINGIFHYLTAMFLLDREENKKKNFQRPGTVIKVLQPLGLGKLLDPVYQVFDRAFGNKLTYGDTVLKIRNKQFVHGSFSPENIKKTVNDSDIFDVAQRIKFIQNHWDLFDSLIILRLQLLSILTLADINFDDFSPSKLYHL